MPSAFLVSILTSLELLGNPVPAITESPPGSSSSGYLCAGQLPLILHATRNRVNGVKVQELLARSEPPVERPLKGLWSVNAGQVNLPKMQNTVPPE